MLRKKIFLMASATEMVKIFYKNCKIHKDQIG